MVKVVTPALSLAVSPLGVSLKSPVSPLYNFQFELHQIELVQNSCRIFLLLVFRAELRSSIAALFSGILVAGVVAGLCTPAGVA